MLQRRVSAGKDSQHRFRKKQKNILAGDYSGKESELVYLNSFTKIMLKTELQNKLVTRV